MKSAYSRLLAVAKRYGGWVTGIVAPFNVDWRHARPIAPYHKGDGHITDDTLMSHALVEVYAKRRRHLSARAALTAHRRLAHLSRKNLSFLSIGLSTPQQRRDQVVRRSFASSTVAAQI